MTTPDETFKIRHVYGGTQIGPGVKAGDLVVLPTEEEAEAVSRKWYHADGQWFLPIVQVFTATRHGYCLAGTFTSRMDAFDFARTLLERHDQVKVAGREQNDWTLLLDRRGDRLPVMLIEFSEVIADPRGPKFFGRVDDVSEEFR